MRLRTIVGIIAEPRFKGGLSFLPVAICVIIMILLATVIDTPYAKELWIITATAMVHYYLFATVDYVLGSVWVCWNSVLRILLGFTAALFYFYVYLNSTQLGWLEPSQPLVFVLIGIAYAVLYSLHIVLSVIAKMRR